MLKRTYHLTVMRPGGFMNWPGNTIKTDLRIRQTVLLVFRKWFGDLPSRHYHKDGFMAEAWDRKGNRIMLEQINNDV